MFIPNQHGFSHLIPLEKSAWINFRRVPSVCSVPRFRQSFGQNWPSNTFLKTSWHWCACLTSFTFNKLPVWLNMTLRVSQGSHLGPLLFTIYLNDIKKAFISALHLEIQQILITSQHYCCFSTGHLKYSFVI